MRNILASTSEFTEILNAIDEMQQAMHYALRRPVLRQVEYLIDRLDAERTALRREVEALRRELDGLKPIPARIQEEEH